MISNYPQGAEYDSNAPYNEEIIESIPVEVTVSFTHCNTNSKILALTIGFF